MSWASCCGGVSPSAAALPIVRSAVARPAKARAEQRRHDTAPALKSSWYIPPSKLHRSYSDNRPRASASPQCVHICCLDKLFCILDGFDLDQKAPVAMPRQRRAALTSLAVTLSS